MYAHDTFKNLPHGSTAAAANQDFLEAALHRETVDAGINPVAWDPYEVWCRMIKEPRARRLATSA